MHLVSRCEGFWNDPLRHLLEDIGKLGVEIREVFSEVGIEFEDVLTAEGSRGCYEYLGLDEVVKIRQVTLFISD
jgi:hypothetical protein